jgi:iron complex outermembrane receptor protein
MNRETNGYIRRAVHAILGGVSALSLGVVAAPAGAADTPAPASAAPAEVSLEEVIVTGLRASLQQSLEIKKSSGGIVDAISAEDIGKFPDANLAEAMMRIPGVTVSRSAVSLTGTGGVTTTGDASQITVRGFGPQFNQTLYDGRTVPTSLGNRGFNFGAVGSDFVNQVDVLKTPDSSLSSGAIGATINIKYPKPFDRPGFQLAGSVSGSDSSSESKFTPNASLLVSDTFADGRFGILADYAYADDKVQGNHINIQGWEGSQIAPSQLAGAAPGASTTPSINDWFIQDYGIYQEHTDDKRIGGRLVLQARPFDGLELTLDDNYSQESIVQDQYGFSVWFNNGSLTNIRQSPNGSVINFIQPSTPTDFQAQINQSKSTINTIGFNVKWDASENTTFVFDAYTAVAKLNPDGETGVDSDVGYGNSPANNTDLGMVVPGGENVPYPVNFGPSGNGSRFVDRSIIGSHVVVASYNQNKDTVSQFKLEGSWHDDALQLKYGVQYTREEEELRSFTDLPYTWQMYAGYGPPPVGTGGVSPIPGNLIANTFGTGSGFISGWGGGGNLPSSILAADGFAIKSYLEGLHGAGMNVGACSNLSGAVPCDGVYHLYENLGAHQDITESTIAPYLNLATTAKIAAMPLDVNAGVRIERTNVTSAGISSLPTGALYVLPQDHTAYGFNSTPPQPISTDSHYTYLLPSLDLGLWVNDQLKVRFDVSRTLTRAPLNLITPDLNVPAGQRVGALNATGGNPTLLPFLSDNLDMGVEWYYAKGSYAAANVFLKEVTNFIVGGTINQGINGVTLPNGSPAIFAVTSQVNGPSAEVRGIELAWQHWFGDSGFGFQANATFVNTDKPYDPHNISVSGFAVTGLANSYNIIPFYEKYGFQARLAINHRAEYLNSFGQLQNNSAFGTEPTFVNSGTYVDFSTSYQFNKHFNLYFTALNLTNQIYSTHGRFSEQLLDVVDSGRQYTLGVHYKL